MKKVKVFKIKADRAISKLNKRILKSHLCSLCGKYIMFRFDYGVIGDIRMGHKHPQSGRKEKAMIKAVLVCAECFMEINQKIEQLRK